MAVMADSTRARPVGLLAGVVLVAVAVLLAVSGGCTTKEPQPTTFFDQTIAPVLQNTCVRANTGAGCHVADPKGNAFGNLDLTGYPGVAQRRDLLLDYGPYLQPSMLVKNVAPYQITVHLWDGTAIPIMTDIKHVGGALLDPTASAYQTLHRWIEDGATENATGVTPPSFPKTACSHNIPSAAGFDPNNDPTTSDWTDFLKGVQGMASASSILQTSCAAGNCHGTPVNALYLTCGTMPSEVRWNYFAASGYVSSTAEQSEIVRRPLATSQGGSYHEGGPLFSSVQDTNYVALKEWAGKRGPPSSQGFDPAFLFFAQMVQPVLVKKGCMMAQCHSVGMFHDFRLRGGSAGSFSLTATRRNYGLAVAQMSFESDDVGSSRLVRKNLFRPDEFTGANGIAHRGGPLFEDFGAQLPTGALCDMGAYMYDPQHVDKIPAYCVVREWHRQERAARNLAPVSAVVYVSRPPPPSPDRPQDFDVFAGGSSLHVAPVAPAPLTGALTVSSDQAVDLSACGLGGGPDIRRPAVSWDAKTIAFAARATASDSLAIYTANADGTGCAKQADIAAGHGATAGGLPVHDFDPAFSPPAPDGVERIVFASTRGNLDSGSFDYSGPQRTPEDPTKPNANLYVLEPDPAGGGAKRVRQLTWQLNMERFPSFMQDGRLVFTAEKREPGFYQLALRRQNLDGADYHPLYAQRVSIGFDQATSVAELSYKDFAAIFSNHGAQHGAGALAVFNRSIGVDFTSQDPAAYPVDPAVIMPGSPSAPEPAFFLHSLRTVLTDGSYTSPAALPDGKVLVSFGAGDPASFGGDYDVYVLDPVTGNKTKLLGNAGTAEVDAVAVYARADKGIFVSTPDEPNGNTSIQPVAYAQVTVLDTPVLASLLFQNTPTGRVVEQDLGSFEVYEEMPPDVSSFPGCGANTACDAYGKVYVRRRLLGSVPLRSDGSARFNVPGGMPIVLHLAQDSESRQMHLPRWQREAMTFVPGEFAHQAFPRAFFNNLCAGCHSSLSGRAVDAALLPDFLTQASQVVAATAPAIDLSGGPGSRGAIIGAPANP
jgi:hypothetical protein